MKKIIFNEFSEHIKTVNNSIDTLSDSIEKAANLCISSLNNNGKILIFGNGGSAADSQHIAAEFVGRYKTERQGLSAIALTTDTSALTAIGNDYGYDRIFERQVEALALPNDVLIGISTGGTSENVIKAFNKADNIGCKKIGLSGRTGGEMNKCCDVNIVVPSYDTPRIQEMHILIGHTICQLIDLEFTQKLN